MISTKFICLSNRKLYSRINIVVFVFEGVAIGAGWQHVVAYINIGCYYLVGLPAGILLGFKFNLGVEVKYCRFFRTN